MTSPNIFVLGGAALVSLFIIWVVSWGGSLERPFPDDPNTLSNYKNSSVNLYLIGMNVNFDTKTIEGELEVGLYGNHNDTELFLDIKDLNIIKVTDKEHNSLFFEIRPAPVTSQVYGEQLYIKMNSPLLENKWFSINITYTTKSENKAFHWVSGKNTVSKQPLVYAYAYPNLAKSIFPCLDTPVMKGTRIRASIRVPKGIRAFVSGRPYHWDESKPAYNEFFSELDEEMSVSSFVFVAGGFEKHDISYNRYLIAEDLSDLHKEQINISINVIEWMMYYHSKAPYDRKSVSHVIMPSSFPFPVLATADYYFIHPNLLTKEPSRIYDISSQIAFFYSALIIKAATFDDLWIGEGISRLTFRELFNQNLQGQHIAEGVNISLLDTKIGYLRMIREVIRLGDEATSLHPNTTHVYPLDVAVPVIQGEKAYHLLMKVKRLITPYDPKFFDDLLQAWYFWHHHKRVTTRDVIKQMASKLRDRLNYFDRLKAVADIPLYKMVKELGIPESEVDFNTPLLSEVEQLAKDYIAAKGDSSPTNFANLKQYTQKVQLIFFELLLLRADEVTPNLVARLEKDYKEIVYGDYDEIKSAWFQLCAVKDYMKVSSQLTDFLSSTGVTDHIRPIYRALNNNGRSLFARNILELNVNFYHPFVYSMIRDELFQ